MNYKTYKQSNKSIYLVDMKSYRGKIFGEISEKGIAKYISQGKNILIISNKKWLNTGIICQSCGHVPMCKYCDVPISYHLNLHDQIFGMCNVCKQVYQTIEACDHCWSLELETYGVGMQQISDYLHIHYNINPYTISSTDLNSWNKANKFISDMEQPGGKVIISTSIITRLDIKFDLIIVQNSAFWLHIPDYNSELNNFQFLRNIVYDTNCDHIILQTHDPDNHIISSIVSKDLDGFVTKDNEFKQKHIYPPYGEICVILYKNSTEERMFGVINKLYQEMLILKNSWWYEDIQIYAIPPMIYKMYNKYRYQIVVRWSHIRSFIDDVYLKLNPFKRWFKFDWWAKNTI